MAGAGPVHRPALPRHEPAHRAPMDEMAGGSRSAGFTPMARPVPAHAAIDEAHGDIDSYLDEVLGVDQAMREKLRAHYLEV